MDFEDLHADEIAEDLDFDEDISRRQRQLTAIIHGQGVLSRELGLSRVECPYPDWTPHSVLWLEGYTGSHFMPVAGHA